MKQLWQQIFQYTLGALVAVGLYWVTYLLIMKSTPENNKDALLIVLGVLASQFANVVQYFFGSSKGSADKTDLMKK
jgi:predicted CDP-diglyceride synthetase/phosphatidate cytidylyltransferase